jgi:hypothetical protein
VLKYSQPATLETYHWCKPKVSASLDACSARAG